MMDALTALKEFTRLTKVNRVTGICGISCSDCRLSSNNNGENVACNILQKLKPEIWCDIVERWATENPILTRQIKFLREYPETKLDYNGIISICPRLMGYTPSHCQDDLDRINFRPRDCKGCRERYWSESLEFDREFDTSCTDVHYSKSICTSAEKCADEMCNGYAQSENDDEPIEMCKSCDRYVGHETTE